MNRMVKGLLVMVAIVAFLGVSIMAVLVDRVNEHGRELKLLKQHVEAIQDLNEREGQVWIQQQRSFGPR